jgi:hypothetical protein
VEAQPPFQTNHPSEYEESKMSISSEFNGNPQVWSLTHRFVTPAASYVGAPGALPSGDGSFVFDASMVYAGNNGSILRIAGWTDLFDSFNAVLP